MISKSDTNRDAIKSEIAEQMNEIYDKLCQAIDADSAYLTDGFWAEMSAEKSKDQTEL